MTTRNLAAEQQIFLLPNGTFFAELIIFLIVLLLLWKVILPPIQRALADRHDMVQKTIENNDTATKKFQAAEEKYRKELADARAESARLRDEARAEGRQVLDELRARATEEVEQIRQRGEQQLAAQRERVLAELTPQVAELSTQLASRVLSDDVSQSPRHGETVASFLGAQTSGKEG